MLGAGRRESIRDLGFGLTCGSVQFQSSTGRRRALASLGLVLLALIAAPRPAWSLKLNVLALKVAMIGKIAEFVHWPASAGLDDPDRPFEFVILGTTPLEPMLVSYYRQVRISGHRVFVRRARDLSDVGQPHLLFVARSMEDEIERVVAGLKEGPVLTVADSEGFAQRGLAVNLYLSDDQLRFEISRRALQRHKLEASYHLLSLARLIDDQQALR
jgi:hypothetical protein